MGHSFGGRVCPRDRRLEARSVSLWTLICVNFAPDIAAAGRRHTGQSGSDGQPDVFKGSVDAAMAYHGEENVPADSPVRARYGAFGTQTAQRLCAASRSRVPRQLQTDVRNWAIGAGAGIPVADAFRELDDPDARHSGG